MINNPSDLGVARRLHNLLLGVTGFDHVWGGAASLGVTATGHMSASWADLASYKRLARAGRMTLRVSVYLPLEDWRTVSDSVHRNGAGDDWVRIGGVKGYMDGSAGSRTAFFFEGRLVESGPTKQIFTQPRQKQTDDYIRGRFG